MLRLNTRDNFEKVSQSLDTFLGFQCWIVSGLGEGGAHRLREGLNGCAGWWQILNCACWRVGCFQAVIAPRLQLILGKGESEGFGVVQSIDGCT